MFSSRCATDPVPGIVSVVGQVPVAGRALPVERFPDGTMTLLFRVTAPGQGDLSVAGPRTRALFKEVPPLPRYIKIQFKPGGAAPLLGIAPSELVDRVVLLEELWGAEGRDLCERLLAARDAAEVVEQLQHALWSRGSRTFESASARLARRAVRLLGEHHDLGIDALAERLGVTARHLRRAFIESVGVGPKQFARMVRLQRAMRAASTSSDWARIAKGAGYYDQAHLITDFQELVGVTPSAFLRHAAKRALRIERVRRGKRSDARDRTAAPRGQGDARGGGARSERR
ncbi:AraC family transcriptional regulator [Sorangium sp. So ce302]|uniref:helix-turn-helix domain-containing protein n=1 Tax=Sorangium sp. So ce302 TaxID=3133297 RepID=UPI003F64463D